MAIETILAILVGLLLLMVTFMAVEGLMGAAGIVRFDRCRACDHLFDSRGVCPYCHHQRLAHLIHVRMPAQPFGH